jgi:hypothetical protein
MRFPLVQIPQCRACDYDPEYSDHQDKEYRFTNIHMGKDKRFLTKLVQHDYDHHHADDVGTPHSQAANAY